MNGDEDLGEDIIMKGEPFHYHQMMAQVGADGDKKAGLVKQENSVVSDEAEKVSVLQTPIARVRTTYYAQEERK